MIHRDYSLSGKDVKIAIFDDKVEITSPGKLMPTVDFSDMDSGQSDIRNKILAPVFKRLGIIEQWGNGLRLIAREMQSYPEIELSWKEPGIAFRVTFTNRDYLQQQELQQESLFSKVLKILKDGSKSRKDISLELGQKSISGQLNEILKRLQEGGLIDWTIKDKPQSSKQKFQITEKGNLFLKLLNRNRE